jgi:mRNA-degrading endonuclease toxin of MazEF toxin-antitoxin module
MDERFEFDGHPIVEGSVFYANLDGLGVETQGRRPVIVVSTSDYPSVVVVPCTSQPFEGAAIPLRLGPHRRLSFARVGQLRSIDFLARFTRHYCSLSHQQMAEVMLNVCSTILPGQVLLGF